MLNSELEYLSITEMAMGDPTMSPDGKFMWTGSEWIPAPPKSSSQSANILLQDSVIAGDVTISNNDIEDIKKAMIDALTELDVIEGSIPDEPTGQEQEKIDKVLQLSSQLIENDIQLEPNIEEILAKIAWKKRCTKPYPDDDESEKLKKIEISHLNRAFELYQREHNLGKSARVMLSMLNVFSKYVRDDRLEALSIAKKSLDLARKVPDRALERNALDVLSWSDVESNQAEHKALADKVRERRWSAESLSAYDLEDMTFLEGSSFISKFLEEKSWLNGPAKGTQSPDNTWIGEFYLKHNKLEDAEKWFLLNVEEDDDNWVAYLKLGELERLRKNYEKAIDYFSLALKHTDFMFVREICLLHIASAEESRGNVRASEEYRSRAISMLKSEYPKEKFTGTKEAIIMTLEGNEVANARQIVEQYF